MKTTLVGSITDKEGPGMNSMKGYGSDGMNEKECTFKRGG